MSQLEREAVARTILEVAALYSRWVGRLAEADVTVDLFFMDKLEDLALDLLGVPAESEEFCRDWHSFTFFEIAVDKGDLDGYIKAVKSAKRAWEKKGAAQ